MPDMTDIAASGAAELGTKLVVKLYEKWSGNRYSEEEIEKLKKLQKFYQQCLQVNSAPVAWMLDEEDHPTHHMDAKNWELHLQRATFSRGHVGNYHYQSKRIAEYAATYLAVRGNRFIGKGKRGDLLAQFMSEWIDFALNELPTYGFDKFAIEKINRRINYIETVKKSDIFNFGIVDREKNKFHTIENIKKQLAMCRDVASQEASRQNAREKFNECCIKTRDLLLTCVEVLYYARQTNVEYEPFELQCYAGIRLVSDAINPYLIVKQTHTGQMLFDVVCLSGLESFGVVAQKLPVIQSQYFDERYQCRKVIWDVNKADLPPWIVSSEEKISQLTKIQMFAQTVLRVAQLKKLIDAAYELTGAVGDLWAYGDKQGKKSLKALLFLMDAELEILKKQFDEFYHFNNARRESYNDKNRVNGDRGVNPNFNKLDFRKNQIQQFYEAIKSSIKSIQEQMTRFPENFAKEMDAKKQLFYQNLNRYFNNFYPKKFEQFKFSEHVEQKTVAKAQRLKCGIVFALPIKQNEAG